MYDLRKKIQCLQRELDELKNPISDMPELITSANLLRSNEYLKKLSEKQSQLLSAYDQYSVTLEKMVVDIFDIQNDLKNVLKEQLNLISNDKPVKASFIPTKKKSLHKRKSTKN